MMQNAQLMKCGACGNDTVKIFTFDGKQDFVDKLAAECTLCKSVTTIEISSSISLGWGENSKGILCVFRRLT